MASRKLTKQDRLEARDARGRCQAHLEPIGSSPNVPPTTVAGALRYQLESHHESGTSVARAIGATNVAGTARSLWRWINAHSIPRHKESLERLAAIEKHYGLAEGYFAGFIAKTNLSYLRHSCRQTPFQQEFAYQMVKHSYTCLSLASIVAEADCRTIKETFANWKTGRSQPRWKRYYRLLSKIEHRYGLSDGHFRRLLAKPQSPRQLALKSFPEAFVSLARWHLPDDFDSRPGAEQQEIVKWVSTNILAGGTKFGRYQAAKTRDAFCVIFPNLQGVRRSRRRDGRERGGSLKQCGIVNAPSDLAAEMQAYVTFKTASLPPVGLRRYLKWSSATADSNILRYGLVFGALAASRESVTRGYGVKLENISFAMLAFPKVWDWYLRWREQRRGFFSAHEASVLFEAKAALRRPTGWIRQNPGLVVRVRPIDGLISEEEIARARTNWDLTCENCIEELKQLIAELGRVQRKHRDSYDSIFPVLNSESPLSEYKKVTSEILRYMPSEGAAPVSTAVSVRSYLLIRFGMHLGFRQRNLRELLLCKRGDKPRTTTELEGLRRGELRWLENVGAWEVFAPAVAFKNSDSSFFRDQPFSLLLPDSEAFYEYIKDYITVHRPLLLGGKPDPGTFFVRSARSSARSQTYDMFSFYRAWKTIIQRYGIYNPYTGRGAIAGLLPHGSHALRDVIATHVLKLTGSYELASFAIQDSVDTVIHHYARFLPHEKIARAAVILNNVWLPTS